MSSRYFIAHAIVITILDKLDGEITAEKFDQLVQIVENILEKEDING